MTKKLGDVMSGLSRKRREKIEHRGKELLNEYMTLAELRKAQQLTQKELAEKLQVNQENISRLEKRSDMMLSTLRHHVEAMGGELSITVQFPDHTPIRISGLADISSEK
ncbi:MAG: XRE family transcriptional regulator [Candidatus Hydrogenedentes bacterium]|nr:XRE family transcriptional regulator [Candidatus Hydrogenedentota bacterium]